MPSKEFTFGFVLSAAMNSSFASSFAKASREVDELRKYMDKLGEETQQLQKAFGAGIINEKTFNTAVMQKFQFTHPMRGATNGISVSALSMYISIHAPHAGCDSMVKIFRFYRRFQRHFREAENLPCTYRGFSQFFLLLASPSRYRIIVSLGS